MSFWNSGGLLGGGAETLQDAYNRGSGPGPQTIQIDATRRGIAILDTQAGDGGTLFAVESQDTLTQYLAVSAAGISTTQATVLGPIQGPNTTTTMLFTSRTTGASVTGFTFNTSTTLGAGSTLFTFQHNGVDYFKMTANAFQILTFGNSTLSAPRFDLEGLAASSGTTTTPSPLMRYRGHYWDGAASQLLLASQQMVVTATTPAGYLTTQFGSAVGTTQNFGYRVQNITAAAAGAQQYSPLIVLEGLGWQTTTPTSEVVQYALQNRPVQGTTHPSGDLVFWLAINGGAYAEQFSWSSSLSALRGPPAATFKFQSQVADGGVAYVFDTLNALAAGGSNVFSVRNHGSEIFGFDNAGNPSTPNIFTALITNSNLGGGGNGGDGEAVTEAYRAGGVGAIGRISAGGTTTTLCLGGIPSGSFWTDVAFYNAGAEMARFKGGAQLALKRVGIAYHRTATATSYTALATDTIIGVTSTAAARTITLPAANAVPAGYLLIVQDESNAAGTNNITIAPAGADTITGPATITSNGGRREIYSDGSSKWFSA